MPRGGGGRGGVADKQLGVLEERGWAETRRSWALRPPGKVSWVNLNF